MARQLGRLLVRERALRHDEERDARRVVVAPQRAREQRLRDQRLAARGRRAVDQVLVGHALPQRLPLPRVRPVAAEPRRTARGVGQAQLVERYGQRRRVRVVREDRCRPRRRFEEPLRLELVAFVLVPLAEAADFCWGEHARLESSVSHPASLRALRGKLKKNSFIAGISGWRRLPFRLPLHSHPAARLAAALDGFFLYYRSRMQC